MASFENGVWDDGGKIIIFDKVNEVEKFSRIYILNFCTGTQIPTQAGRFQSKLTK